MTMLDMITGGLGFLFTLLIFSYLIGDNPLFRIGVYLFVGVSAGYIAAVAWWQVLYPKLIYPLMNGNALLLVPAILGVLILMKISPRLAGLGSLAMSFMVGVGAAVTIVGAVSGTLIPQVMGTINAFEVSDAARQDVGLFAETMLSGAFILVGVIFSLAYFHFGARPNKTDGSLHRMKLIDLAAWIGRVFIGVTLGAIFAGVFSAALTAFIERINALILFIEKILLS